MNGSSLERLLDEMMLASLHQNQNKNVSEIQRTEKKVIQLPKSMSLLEGAQELKRQHQELEEEIEVVRIYQWQWKDVLIAIKKVTEKTFGWLPAKKDKRGNKPMLIDVVTDVKADGTKVSEEAFYGNICITQWEDATMTINVGYHSHVVITLKKRYKEEASQFLDSIETHLMRNSIYRNKGLEVIKGSNGIEFNLFTPTINDKIVLGEEVKDTIDNFIVPDLIEKGKTVTLLQGSYGNGKTATVTNISALALSKGLTYFYVKNSATLKDVLKMTKNYGACMVFMEDIDEITAGNTRDHEINMILNTIDGTEMKDSSAKIFFTSNHANKINRAMRRAGRIDYILHLKNPTDENKINILKELAKDLKGYKNVDWTQIEPLVKRDGQASFWAEAGGRLKLIEKAQGKINTAAVKAAVHSIYPNLDFMLEEVEESDSFKTKIGEAWNRIADSLEENM